MKMVQLYIVVCVVTALVSCDSMIDDAGDAIPGPQSEKPQSADDPETDEVPAAENAENEVYSISGRVDNCPADSDVTFLLNGTLCDSTVTDGEFTIEALEPGSYSLAVESDEIDPVPASIKVEISDADVDDLVFFAGSNNWQLLYQSEGHAAIQDILYDRRHGAIVAAGYHHVAGKGKQIFIGSFANSRCTWSHTVGGSSSDEAVKIIPVSDGGYAVLCNSVMQSSNSGVISEHIRVITLSETGQIISDIHYGGDSTDRGYDIIEADGSYIVAGTSASFATEGGRDWVVYACETDGTLLWEQTGGTSGDDGAVSLVPYDNTYLAALYIYDASTEKTQIMVATIDASGGIREQEIYYAEDEERPAALAVSNESIYVAAVAYDRPARGSDGKVLKIDADLSLVDMVYCGGATDDVFHDIGVTADGTVAVGGFTTKTYGYRDRDSCLVTFDEDLGNIRECRFPDNTVTDEIKALSILPSGEYMTGGFIGYNKVDTMYMMCLGRDGTVQD